MKSFGYAYLFTLLLSLTFLLPNESAAWIKADYTYPLTDGERVYEFGCKDARGVRVHIYADPALPDIGMAYLSSGPDPVPFIALNPVVLSRLPFEVQMFWFGHECAHHAQGHLLAHKYSGYRDPSAESRADCWSIRTLRYQYGFGYNRVRRIAGSLMNLRGSRYGHLPGPARAANLLHCFQ